LRKDFISSFCVILLTDSQTQTDRQTDTGEDITSLAEVIRTSERQCLSSYCLS